MSQEAEDLSELIEKLLQAERMGVVVGWVLGSGVGRGRYGLRVRVRTGHEHVVYGDSPSVVVDMLVVKLVQQQEGNG